jgi:hypothetical protein
MYVLEKIARPIPSEDLYAPAFLLNPVPSGRWSTPQGGIISPTLADLTLDGRSGF